ncbi:hypothetical protein NDU88_009178 [Pleurodeles waltl]|uniref:Uncharacterized protein n=1 Tax=Pleurodeles waltl TaxID=8319 RepID=A0AAV7RVT6_PLEWA|nr:hypothetical protein NDU88_009163 [Pleurodeles waltl]KAJ1156459.1 hypothetical protein NDU88_009178 [Pleurodeles waltl]
MGFWLPTLLGPRPQQIREEVRRAALQASNVESSPQPLGCGQRPRGACVGEDAAILGAASFSVPLLSGACLVERYGGTPKEGADGRVEELAGTTSMSPIRHHLRGPRLVPKN